MLAVDKTLIRDLAALVGQHLNNMMELRQLINNHLNKSLSSACSLRIGLTVEGDVSVVLNVASKNRSTHGHLCSTMLDEFVKKVRRGMLSERTEPLATALQSALLVEKDPVQMSNANHPQIIFANLLLALPIILVYSVYFI